jgi:Ca2+-transporting ATPase
MDWHSRDPEALRDELDTGPDGLTAAEAAARLDRVGPNELTGGEERSARTVFLAQFRSGLVWVLVFAAVVSALVGHAIDALLIVTIVAANGVFGFVQEYRAERSLAALRELSAPAVHVRRDGATRTVPARNVVPGDLLVLGEGDAVPADARLVEAAGVETDEAPLTGESVPVEKTADTLAPGTPLAERTNVVYAGTHVTRGNAVAFVVATGMDTEVGRIAAELETAASPPTPLQRDLDRLGGRLGVAVIGLSAVVLVLLLAAGADWVTAGLTAVSLAVAAIPEGLPAVVTLTLALGVRRMARENALVRSLPAVEALGAVDVVCTDKTGTLTEGEMRAVRVWVPGGEYDLRTIEVVDDPLRGVLEAAVLCNDATVERGDPTERALVHAAADLGVDVAALRAAQPRHETNSFSAEQRLMTTVHADTAYVKGAPETVLERSTRTPVAGGPTHPDGDLHELVSERASAMAAEGLRVLALARGATREPETDLTFLGLVGLRDPPRQEVAAAIAETRSAGIDVKVVTGDTPETAAAVAAQLGLGTRTLTGYELADLSDATLRERVAEVDVFARVTPADKVRILRALQGTGHTVAMTGDGVNDAPALRGADVGISMGVRGTDVAKSASDIVLLDDNYATIRTAVRRGRTVFDNIWAFVAYLLSANLAEVALVLATALLGYLILPAVQLLWINLLTDGLPALAIGVDPEDPDVMRRPPRPAGAGIIDRPMLVLIGGAASVTTVVVLGLALWALDGAPATTPRALTIVFTAFVVFEFVKLYVVRWAKGTSPFSNRWLALAVLVSLALHLAVLYTPLGDAFGTIPLGVGDWLAIGVALAVALPGFLAVAVVVRRLRRGGARWR